MKVTVVKTTKPESINNDVKIQHCLHLKEDSTTLANCYPSSRRGHKMYVCDDCLPRFLKNEGLEAK